MLNASSTTSRITGFDNFVRMAVSACTQSPHKHNVGEVSQPSRTPRRASPCLRNSNVRDRLRNERSSARGRGAPRRASAPRRRPRALPWATAITGATAAARSRKPARGIAATHSRTRWW